MLRKRISTALYATASFAAKAYVAGRTSDDALRVCRRLNRNRWRFTICPWDGEGDSKESVLATYQEALRKILLSDLDIYLSVKFPSLGYDRDLLVPLVELAAQRGIRIHFDSLAPTSADATLQLAADLSADFSNVGITLPARWKRSLDDARRFANLPVAIRLVKGQWEDPDMEAGAIDGNFLALAEALRGRRSVVAVASHDRALAALSLETLRSAGTPCELEQLYGLPYRAEVAGGSPIRIYVPYGSAYLPYAVSMLRKKPMVLWWLIRDSALTFCLLFE